MAACVSNSEVAYVYCGEGAGHRSILSAIEGLQASLSVKVIFTVLYATLYIKILFVCSLK